MNVPTPGSTPEAWPLVGRRKIARPLRPRRSPTFVSFSQLSDKQLFEAKGKWVLFFLRGEWRPARIRNVYLDKRSGKINVRLVNVDGCRSERATMCMQRLGRFE